MRAIFFLKDFRQPVNALAQWAASLQAAGAQLRHTAAWSDADNLSRRHTNGSTCNVDGFLLGPATSLESHVAQYCGSGSSGGGEGGLLLVSLEPSPRAFPRSGVVLLIWQPQVPHDIIQACSALPPCLTDGACAGVRGLLLVDASPSLTLSVTHKALEGAGLQAMARKPIVLASRTAQAPQATLQALLQLADALPLLAPPAVPQQCPPLAPGSTVRIAIARDDAFCPAFPENLTLLQQAGAQLLFFSPLYDAALPAGAVCLYLSSGPLEPERWQQLAANQPLLAAVRAFCEAGALVLAEGAGLLYLSRSVDLSEEEDGGRSKPCVLDMAGYLPFKARLLPEPQSGCVQLLVAGGNPLLPAGARPRGYLSAQASLVLVEERQLQSLLLLVQAAGKGAGSPQLNTTYDVTVVKPGEGDAVATAAAPAPQAPEGYTLNNVLASSCLLFLPSEPGLAAHWLRRCACIDAAALAAKVAQQLGGAAAAVAFGKLGHFQGAALSSAAASRTGSRRQSIQDVSALTAAYASNGSCCSGAYPVHPANPHPTQHAQAHLNGGPACGGAGCGGASGSLSRQTSNLSHSSSAAGASGLGLLPPRRSLCGPPALPPAGPPHDVGGSGWPPCRSPTPHGAARSAQTSPVPPTLLGLVNLAPSESPGLLRQGWAAHQQQPFEGVGCGLRQVYGSDMSLSSLSTAPAVRQKLETADEENEEAAEAMKLRVAVEAEAAPAGLPSSPRCLRDTATGTTAAGCRDPHLPLTAEPLPVQLPGAYGPGYAPVHPHRLTADSVAATPMAPAAAHMHHCAASAGSFAEYGASSSCSLPELPYQRQQDFVQSGYVGWGGLGAGPGWLAGMAPAGAGPAARHDVGMFLGAASHGAVVCCSPGACEALVAMGLANRLAGVGSDCDHPPDVCASRRVVLSWVPQEEVPQGAAARGIRVIMPASGGQPQQQHGSGGGLLALGRGAHGAGQCAGRTGRGAGRSSAAAGGQRVGSRGGGQALLVDELALRQEPPAALVLPDTSGLSAGELVQIEQALAEMGIFSAGGGPSSACRVLHTNCRTLVDVMDLMLELGAAAGEPLAASLMIERLQARLRRVLVAAAGGPPSRMPSAGSAASGATLAAPQAGPLAAPPRRPRVLVLQSVQPLVEPGRWVPEMLALAGASSCLAQPGGPDVSLTWQDVRQRAAPDVLIILAPPNSGARSDGTFTSGFQKTHGSGGSDSGGLNEQLAELAAQPGWWCLPAVRESRTYLLQSPYCVRPGPRLVDGVELLARLLLPGQYSSSRKVPAGAVMRLALTAGQRCRATLLPSYFVPMTFN